MRYIEAPEEYEVSPFHKTVFLAGGITGTRDWQSELVSLIADGDVTVYNPRRENFPIGDPSVAQLQIEWEHRHLARASAIAFWFPPETLCPIALYELGFWMPQNKPLFVGTDPLYARRQDVIIQSRLERPALAIFDRIDQVADSIMEWLE